MRHTLIRLRAQKPALFGNRPIPLREDDIRRDDTFTAILAQEVGRYACNALAHGGNMVAKYIPPLFELSAFVFMLAAFVA